jgi:hypothetical protein
MKKKHGVEGKKNKKIISVNFDKFLTVSGERREIHVATSILLF